ncbi:MAG TPA: efflux RND transporter periplasmic adaptor subunit [Candidatus Polarisedimenticolia bacterium]|nr:efflux RND transporter periplasmic adaptor subunit [Candidatus Polarisedimenticolia bacterium]
MSRKGIFALAAAAFVMGAGLTAVALRAPAPAEGRTGAPEAAAGRTYYCPMHPGMVSDRPGDCPICHMRLVPFEEDGERGLSGADAAPAAGGVAGRAPVRIPSQKQQLIGVRSQAVAWAPLVRQVRTVGRVTYDEKRLHHVHTKVGGWIEHLFEHTTGELVKQGEPLLTIYSPELLASQEEYLLALRARDRLAGVADAAGAHNAQSLVASARRRLLLFDMSETQIAALEASGKASRTTTLQAPITGHIIMRNVLGGEKIDPGTTVLDIADLSQVWVLADVYEYELPFVKAGQKATMTLSYLPGRVFAGKVSLIYPVLSKETRTVKVRLEFSNLDLSLKPEMYAEVTLLSDMGPRLTVPSEAVLRAGDEDLVFVDRGEGYFDPRLVKLGVRLPDSVEVLEGLAEGERVVVSGNFLIDSESQLKAALSGFTPPGSGPPAGHAHEAPGP